MAEHPLKIFEKVDPELLKLVQDTNSLALDASQGTAEGIRSLAQQAMKAGATQEEIAEAIRVAQYICGVGSVYTAAHAFKDLF
ncbi:MAG: carboxymuconolactone decarboxylase family protein [Thermodesulfobacteriota bacterium]|jgi:alkylhydroperoxidase/carboxymuconolactone decarboxylase family protein YurZ